MVGVNDGVGEGHPMPVARSQVGVAVGVAVRTRVGRGLGVFVGRLAGGQVGLAGSGPPHWAWAGSTCPTKKNKEAAANAAKDSTSNRPMAQAGA
jgi:hypothetical protein